LGLRDIRTRYGGDSDQHWQALLENLQFLLAVELDLQAGGENDEEGQRAKEELSRRFRLEARSDAAQLEGVSMDLLRERHQDAQERPLSSFGSQSRYFLLADDEVQRSAHVSGLYGRGMTRLKMKTLSTNVTLVLYYR
jgi:hypothetical protein